MVEGSLNTPHYVLKQGNQPTRPKLVAIDPSDPTTQATVLFGFSDKPQYDTFHASCLPLELTPYPLVKRYLIDQLESEGQDLKLDNLPSSLTRSSQRIELGSHHAPSAIR
jgi:hypothetical protein